MFRHKISGIAVAATLGTATLLGATYANAAIDLDATDKSKPTFLYASELLSAAAVADVDGTGDNMGTTYRGLDVETSGDFNVTVKLGHTALPNDIIEVTFELTNMAFGSTTVSTLRLGAETPVNLPARQGMSSVSGTLIVPSAGAAADTVITLTVPDADGFAITPSGNGTIAATIRNASSERTAMPIAPLTMRYENAIQVGTALAVMATPNVETAHAETEYRSLLLTTNPADYTKEANVGKIYVGRATPTPRNPAGGAELADLTAIIATGTDDPVSSVALSGMFGFAAMTADAVTGVTLDEEMDCSGTVAGGDATAVVFADDATGMSNKLAIPDAGLDHYVCITRADDQAFPDTGEYMATVEFAVASGTAPGSVTLTLGEVMRSGTTFHLPYIVANTDRYRQRLVFMNRSGGDLTCSLTVTEGTEAGEPMELMVAAGHSLVKIFEVVTLMDMSRASATIDCPTSPVNLDAASQLVDREGSTDVTILQAE